MGTVGTLLLLILQMAVYSVSCQPTSKSNTMSCGYSNNEHQLSVVSQQISEVSALLKETRYYKWRTPENLVINEIVINNPSLGFTYHLMFNPKTWDDAQEDCVNKGLQLASINSIEEHNFMVEFSEINPVFLEKYSKGIWLGGTDLGHEACWVWTEPQIRLINGFTKWHINEPNNYGKSEDCLEMKLDKGDYGWNDIPCSLWRAYLCKQVTGTQVTSGVNKDMITSTPLCDGK